jgi:hypothetical protein
LIEYSRGSFNHEGVGGHLPRGTDVVPDAHRIASVDGRTAAPVLPSDKVRSIRDDGPRRDTSVTTAPTEFQPDGTSS